MSVGVVAPRGSQALDITGPIVAFVEAGSCVSDSFTKQTAHIGTAEGGACATAVGLAENTVAV